MCLVDNIIPSGTNISDKKNLMFSVQMNPSHLLWAKHKYDDNIHNTERGRTNTFQADSTTYSWGYYQQENSKQLYKSRNDKKLWGVCGGIANFFASVLFGYVPFLLLPFLWVGVLVC